MAQVTSFVPAPFVPAPGCPSSRNGWPHLGLIAIVVALTLGPAARALAAEIEEIEFADSAVVGEARLPLHGLGLLRYRVLFRGYVGALYLPEGLEVSRVFEDVPKALELYYFWDIEGRFFGEAADELLARNLPPERMAALRTRLERLHALYKDVEEGDRYRLAYAPGEGMTLTHNGQPLGTIPGADFAADYFSIWLGDAPLNAAFRDQIFEGRGR